MSDKFINAYDLPAPTRAKWTLRCAIIGFVVLITWAWFAEIDQVTRAPAQVIAKARTQLVQTPEGGVLERLLVKEGDKVTKGQILAVLEQSRVQAAVNDTKAKVAALSIALARLNAEVFGRPLEFDPNLSEYKEYIRNQTDLFNRRQRALKESIAALGDSLKLAKAELELNEPLLSTGDVAKSDLLRLQRQVTEIQAQITNQRNKYFQDAQAEMTKTQEELNTQRESLSDRLQMLDHTQLTAPTSGIVKNIRLNTEGGVLRSGEELMHILPTDSDLIVEAKLRPADVAFIKIGLPAVVKLDAYDYAIYGSMRGTVAYISADTISEETRQGEVVYYRVQIKVIEHEFKGRRG